MKYLFSRVTLGTVSVCVLAILFTAFTLRTAKNIVDQADLLYQHPYRVTSAAQAMRTRLLEVRVYLLPVLLQGPSTQAEAVYKMLDERDLLQDQSFAVIRDYYLTSQKDISDLATAMAALRNARRQAVRDCAAITDPALITQYLDTRVIPLSYVVDDILQRIAGFANSKAEQFRQKIKSTQTIMNIGAVLLCALLIALVIFVSVNERRKNQLIAYREQLFNLLSKSIADVFFIYNRTNRQLEYVSENCFRMLGITAREFYREGVVQRGLTPEAAAALQNLLDADTSNDEVEHLMQYQRGLHTLDLKLRLYPIHTDNRISRSIVVLTDQTRDIAQQTALRDALFSARKANEAKQEFLSRMSHEIRTPMNAIIGMTAIAARYMGDKERMEDCLNKIAISSKHLLSLINDVLDISKIEGGKLSFTQGPFNFRNFIKTLTTIIYPQTLAHQQKFEITIAGLNEETLIGDELRLNQMLINLLSNAIKFTPPGGEIRLDITRLPDEGAKALLRFVVRDTGIGMSKEFLARLYTPFEQADTIAQNYGGTGLGLSITKNLVSLMSGTITVESEEGKGTAFTLELPFELPEQDGERARSVEFDDLNVLVADDDQITCEHAMLLLEQIGVRGDAVNSGAEAVQKVVEAQEAGRDYTVCFIDWRMPGMDGVETARRLREKVGAETPIIIISSYDWSSIEEEARDAGVNAFIAKPLFASSLYNALLEIRDPKSLMGLSAQPGEHYDFKDKKILLAEDNTLNQEIAMELLKSAGLRVDCADDGQQALEMYQASGAGEYALILMDVQMPRLDGYKATQAIRASNHPDAASIPILAMTANAFTSDIRAAKEAGMNGHLAKPIDVSVLFRTIATHLKIDPMTK